MPIQLIVGLGNPGEKYRHTRHNVGFMLLDRFEGSGDRRGWKPWKDLGDYGQRTVGGRPCTLLRAHTYMNETGRAVGDFARYHKIPPADILVCFDELALPLAKIRLRPRGSAGGHNGMQSVLDHLGTEDVPRLRIGIGPLPPSRDAADYVLSRFQPAELDALARALDRSFSAVEDAAARGIESAMNKYNAPAEAGPEP